MVDNRANQALNRPNRPHNELPTTKARLPNELHEKSLVNGWLPNKDLRKSLALGDHELLYGNGG
jgi:hypothetical protein